MKQPRYGMILHVHKSCVNEFQQKFFLYKKDTDVSLTDDARQEGTHNLLLT